MKNRWLDRELFVSPLHFTLCTTDKMLRRELKRLGVPRDNWPGFVPENCGASCIFLESDGQEAAIVTIRDYQDRSGTQVAAMLVHEAVHIWRRVREVLGEDEPSAELEAYAVQHLSQSLMEEFVRQTQ